MEDWEQHFAEKSRRRFEKEQERRRRVRRQNQLTLLMISGAVAAGIAALAMVR